MLSDEDGFKFEISDINTEFGECRCCMVKGYHRDVQKEYYYNNIREVYQDIFVECFNLPLSTHERISRLICTTCVQRLRDATCFRMLVINTERQLLQGIQAKNNVDNVDTVFVNVPDSISHQLNISTEVKIELVEDDTHKESDIFRDLVGNYCEEKRQRQEDCSKEDESKKGQDCSKGVKSKKGQDYSKAVKSKRGQDCSKGVKSKKGQDYSKGVKRKRGQDCSKGDEGERGQDCSKADEGERGEDCSKGDESKKGQDCSKEDDGQKGENFTYEDESEREEDCSKANEGEREEDCSKADEDERGQDCSKGDEGERRQDCSKGDEGERGEDCSKADEGERGQDCSKGDEDQRGDNSSKEDESDSEYIAELDFESETDSEDKTEAESSDSSYTSGSNEDDQPLEPVEGESELLARFSKQSPPLPKRSKLHIICPKYNDHLTNLKDKIVTPQSLEWFFEKPANNQNDYVTEKLALVMNTTTLFQNSNATAFKTRMRSGYPCFYCRQIYNHEALRIHQTTHQKSILNKLLTKYTADEFIVYADIRDLKCTICDQNMKNLTDLKTHLTEIHKKKIYVNCPDRVIPFKLKDNNFDCQVCGLNIETFGALERHMNKHFENFICEECGAGFVTKHRFNVHSYMQHRQSKFSCNVCKKDFSSQLKYKIHYEAVHLMLKKNQCPKCPERFVDYFTKQKHLVDVHGEDPILYKCNICNRSFTRKYTLSLHVKRCHLEQKDVKCEFCPYSCYTKTELKDHMVKHNGTRPYKCSVCSKSYGRNRALHVHMRIHTNDRRHSCFVCGQAFVQRVTLKSHMRTHKMDL